jgi:hypothetical protein
MPKYIIEREVPGAGKLTETQLKGIAEKSVEVLRDMGTKIQWLESFVTDDKIYCVYIADNPATIQEHAKCGGFPSNRISKVHTIISPTTAE